jgi:hypothetical protein
MAVPLLPKRLDKPQRSFIQEIDMTDTEAFVALNFVPPSLRRCIGLLGLLHKSVSGKCHPGLEYFLPFAEGSEADYHNKALLPFSDIISLGSIGAGSSYIYIYIYL